MIGTTQERICDVCRLLDYNTDKKLCGYCGMCDAWICQQDMNAWGRRLKAALKRKLEPGYRGLSDYENHVQLEGQHESTSTGTDN